MSGNSPLVSVLIPAYNHEKYVQETIKSIINQTYKNIELIVIDDGSKDLTWQKIQEMKDECEKRFVRTHIETKENEGTCKTLNRLLDCAQGDFVYIIASDDLAKPLAIEKEVEILSKNPDYALCVGDNEWIDSEGNIFYRDKHQRIVYDKNKAVLKTFGDYLQKKVAKFSFCSTKFGSYDTFYLRNYVPNGYLIRKSIFEKIGYFTPEAPLEDWWLMLQISKYAKLKYLDEVLFSYRWHSTNTAKQTEKMKKIINKTYRFEIDCLENLDINFIPDLNKNIVENVKLNGVKYLSFGIPFIFTFSKHKKGLKKYINLKLFNLINLEFVKKVK